MTVVHEFVTSYNSKKELLNYIKKPDFFYKLAETIDFDKNEKCKFEPEISKNLFSNQYIKWPQKIIFQDKIIR